MVAPLTAHPLEQHVHGAKRRDEEVGVDTQNIGQLLDAVEKLIQAKAA